MPPSPCLSQLIWKYRARGRFLWKGSVRTEGPGVGILVFPPGHPPYAVQLCWFPRLRTAACVHALSDGADKHHLPHFLRRL